MSEYGEPIKEKESLKYVDVSAPKSSTWKGIMFKAKIGVSLKKAAQEVEEYFKSHAYAIEYLMGPYANYSFEYNNLKIGIQSFWNMEQIGHSWLLGNNVKNEMEEMTEISTELYLANKSNLLKFDIWKQTDYEYYEDIANLFLENSENKTEDKVLIQTEEERRKDPQVSLLPLDPKEQKSPKISLLPLKLKGIKEMRLAKQQLKDTAVIKSKNANNLNLEVKDITIRLEELSKNLEKVLNLSSFESATLLLIVLR